MKKANSAWRRGEDHGKEYRGIPQRQWLYGIGNTQVELVLTAGIEWPTYRLQYFGEYGQEIGILTHTPETIQEELDKLGISSRPPYKSAYRKMRQELKKGV